MGRHVVAIPPVDDHRLLGAEPTRGAGRIHGGVAAAINGDAPPQLWGPQPLLLGQTRLLEKAHRIEDAPGLAGRDIDPLGQVGADGHEDGIKAPLTPLGQHILHLVVEGELHPGRQHARYLAIEHGARQAIGGNAKTQHAAGTRARLADLDAVAEPVEVPGAREARGAGPDDEHPLARGRWGRRRQPAEAQRLVAKEALDGVDRDRFVDLGTVAGMLAGVVTDPAMHGR